MATEISPRNIRRHKTALDLSRITHDYETQFDAAKKIVRFAKNSIHDKPENYLNVARAGIDYAMTAEVQDTDKLVKQANEYVRQLKVAFPKAELQEQIKVINVRMLYLENEKEKARSLIDQLDEVSWENEGVDALLDKAKAFHELGLHERAQAVLEQIEFRCKNHSEQGEIFLQYIQQEIKEKSAIKYSSRELNNNAVNFYRRGDIENAMESFTQAFTLMPKNASIALNLLQLIAAKSHNMGAAKGANQLVKKCIKTVENSVLNEDQQERYHKVRSVLDGVG
jgi:tetratricopeptide (TPR) repeat protein